MKLDELKTILDEWEGDALELDYKIASGEIPEFDNADAKMKVNLWFALHDALKQFTQLEAENEALKELVKTEFDFTEEETNDYLKHALLAREQGQVLDRS